MLSLMIAFTGNSEKNINLVKVTSGVLLKCEKGM